jgi:carbamate kinase
MKSRLEVCGADSQGAIGYALQQNLQNILYQRGIKKKVVTVITQTLVDKNDPALSRNRPNQLADL